MNMIDEILRLKRERGAIILAHYYQRPEVQEIADYVGDSYQLSKIAKNCPEKLIIFCGVKFMAESAKILSPEKTVLLPALDAGCPMAEMAAAEEVLKIKNKHWDAIVVTYINSTTEVKALSDVCVTSSNAETIIKNIKEDKIIFLPDKNLGEYLSEKFPDKKFILWDGFCITHKKVRADSITSLKKLKDDLVVLVHPECEGDIRGMADFIGSTGEIIKYAKNSPSRDFVIVTEEGILHTLKKENPNKNFYVPGTPMSCINMKKTTLEDVYNCLLHLKNEITIDEDIRLRALAALLNMHRLAR